MTQSTSLGFPLPTANIRTKRLDDILVIKQAIVSVDAEIVKLINDPNKITRAEVESLIAQAINNVSLSISAAKEIPLTKIINNYTFALSDLGGGVIHKEDDTSARSVLLPKISAEAPWPMYAALTVVVKKNSGPLTITQDTDVIITKASTGTTGQCTITGPGIATFIMVDNNEWLVSGSNISA